MKRLLAMLLAALLICGAVALAEESSAPEWEAYDALIASIKAETAPIQREALMHQAEDLLVGEDQAIAPLYYYSQPYMVADDVHGMYYTPLGNFLFFHATKG